MEVIENYDVKCYSGVDFRNTDICFVNHSDIFMSSEIFYFSWKKSKVDHNEIHRNSSLKIIIRLLFRIFNIRSEVTSEFDVLIMIKSNKKKKKKNMTPRNLTLATPIKLTK